MVVVVVVVVSQSIEFYRIMPLVRFSNFAFSPGYALLMLIFGIFEIPNSFTHYSPKIHLNIRHNNMDMDMYMDMYMDIRS